MLEVHIQIVCCEYPESVVFIEYHTIRISHNMITAQPTQLPSLVDVRLNDIECEYLDLNIMYPKAISVCLINV